MLKRYICIYKILFRIPWTWRVPGREIALQWHTGSRACKDEYTSNEYQGSSPMIYHGWSLTRPNTLTHWQYNTLTSGVGFVRHSHGNYAMNVIRGTLCIYKRIFQNVNNRKVSRCIWTRWDTHLKKMGQSNPLAISNTGTLRHDHTQSALF